VVLNNKSQIVTMTNTIGPQRKSTKRMKTTLMTRTETNTKTTTMIRGRLLEETGPKEGKAFSTKTSRPSSKRSLKKTKSKVSSQIKSI